MPSIEEVRNLARSFASSFTESIKDFLPYQSAFRKFWADKIMNDSITSLRELDDIDPIIRILDSEGKRNYDYDDSSKETLTQRLIDSGRQYGLQYEIEDRRNRRKLYIKGLSAARCMVTQKQWYTIFQDLKSNVQIRSKLNEVLLSDEEASRILLIDELRQINENSDNQLIQKQGVALNAILFAYNIEKYSIVFSLRQRSDIIRAFELGSYREEDSYGTRIVNSNSEILGFNRKYHLDLDNWVFRGFIYSPEGTQIWQTVTPPPPPPPTNVYLILRLQEGSVWQDQPGRIYHFGTNVPNYTKITEGAQVIFDRNVDGRVEYFAEAIVRKVRDEDRGTTTNSGRSVVDKIAELESYVTFQKPVTRSETINSLLQGSPSYNNQHAIRPVSKEVFGEIRAEANVMPFEVPEKWKDEIELLAKEKQIILYGPPGTGKTYAAEEIAKVFVRAKNGVDDTSADNYIWKTQFHPSYSYENFIEGLTAEASADERSVSYKIKNGIFKDLCAEARKIQNAGKAFVLIIDEINRGNIPRIFGELLYAIEKRGRQISLAYSGKCGFFVPENIYIIGTMNTADRSIALIDVALRRRFAFQEMMPEAEQVIDVQSLGFSLPALLTALNSSILSKHYNRERQIGHTYFMGISNLQDFKIVWYNKIIPLLQEYFYGDYKAIAEVIGPKFVKVETQEIRDDLSDEELVEAIQGLYQKTE